MSAPRRPARPLFVAVVALLAVVALPTIARAGTIVRFDTNLGQFNVELYDADMPITVANFLSYVNAGSYDSSIIHRSTTYNPAEVQIFQGGAYAISNNALVSIQTNPPIAFESGTHTNVRGTIAMARTEDLNSATSQFYFNVQDNPALDGGYAVFGKVVDPQGLAVIDTIGSLQVWGNLDPQAPPVLAEAPLIPFEGDLYFVQLNRVQAVPEPSTMALAAVGLAAAAFVRRRNPGRK